MADEEETVLKYERYNKYTSNPLYGALVRVFLVLDVPIILLLTLYTPAPGQAVVTGVVISPPRFLPLIFIAHRAQQSHCSSIFHGVLLTHALAPSASQFVHKKKSPRMDTSMHSGDSKLTYTRLEDNLMRHRGDRLGY